MDKKKSRLTVNEWFHKIIVRIFAPPALRERGSIPQKSGFLTFVHIAADTPLLK